MAAAVLLAALFAASIVGVGAAHAQQQSTVLVLDPLPQAVRTGSTVTFSGQLSTSDGYGVRGATVYLKDDVDFGRDTVMGTLTTDGSGRFHATWAAQPRGSGSWDFYAVFEGGGGFGRDRSRTYSMDVSSSHAAGPQQGSPGQGSAQQGRGHSEITLYRVPASAYGGDTVTFSGRLAASDGTPLAGKRVHIKDNDPGPDDWLASATTDRAGRFSVAWRAEAGDIEKDLDVYAVFDGDASHRRAQSPDQIMRVDRYGGSLTLDPIPASARVGDVITFSGRLRVDGHDPEGSAVYIMDRDRLRRDDLLATAYVDGSGRYSTAWRVSYVDPTNTAEIYAVFEGGGSLARLTTCDPGGTPLFGGLCRDVERLRTLPSLPPPPRDMSGQYMELDYALPFRSDPHVAIVPEPDSYDTVRRHVVPAQEGVMMWTYGMENRHGGDWDVTFEVVHPGSKFQKRPDVIMNLVTPDDDRGCVDQYLGWAERFVRTPVQTHVCSVSGGQVRANADVGRTAAHEFIHAVGLGHTFNVHRDMMCSTEDGVPTCPGSRGRENRPSVLNLDAVAAMYGRDGFKVPNRQVASGERYYASGAQAGWQPAARAQAAAGCHVTGDSRFAYMEDYTLKAGWNVWYKVCVDGPIQYWFGTPDRHEWFEIHLLTPGTDVNAYLARGDGRHYTCEEPGKIWHTKGGSCNVESGTRVLVVNSGDADITLSGGVLSP